MKSAFVKPKETWAKYTYSKKSSYNSHQRLFSNNSELIWLKIFFGNELEFYKYSNYQKTNANQAAFFCFFSLVAYVERKEVRPMATIGIKHIPRKHVVTCLAKCKERHCGVVHFDKVVAPI